MLDPDYIYEPGKWPVHRVTGKPKTVMTAAESEVFFTEKSRERFSRWARHPGNVETAVTSDDPFSQRPGEPDYCGPENRRGDEDFNPWYG